MRAVTIEKALQVARTGAIGSVEVSEPFFCDGGTGLLGPTGRTLVSPGSVDLDFLRSLKNVRAWRPEDAS